MIIQPEISSSRFFPIPNPVLRLRSLFSFQMNQARALGFCNCRLVGGSVKTQSGQVLHRQKSVWMLKSLTNISKSNAPQTSCLISCGIDLQQCHKKLRIPKQLKTSFRNFRFVNIVTPNLFVTSTNFPSVKLAFLWTT